MSTTQTPRVHHRLEWAGESVRVTEVFRKDNGSEVLWILGTWSSVRAARRGAVRLGATFLDETRLGVHNFGL